MIGAKELNEHGYATTPEIDANLAILLDRLNRARMAYGSPFTVTSGLRSESQQEALIAAGKSNAPHSKHLTGQAADVADDDGALRAWVKANMDLMIEIGFWFEAFESTPTWVHFQICPYGSWVEGKSRIFIP